MYRCLVIGWLVGVIACSAEEDGRGQLPPGGAQSPLTSCAPLLEGETRCQGMFLEQCQNRGWVTLLNCTERASACVVSASHGATCVSGASCTPSEVGHQRCRENAVEECSDGAWVLVVGCAESQECVEQSDHLAACLEECTYAGKMGDPCRSDCDCATRHPFQVNGSWYTRDIEQVCLSEEEFGFPGGWCTIPECVQNVVEDPCNQFGYECRAFQFVGSGRRFSLCMELCAGHDDCRPDTTCTPGQANDPALCTPTCPEYWSCGAGMTCDAHGVCVYDAGCRGLTEIADARDGRTYELVEIEGLCWFRDNLAFDADNDFYMRCYDNDDAKCEAYGGLYAPFYDFCPAGSHMATDEEWQELEVAVGLPQDLLATAGWRGSDQGDRLLAVMFGGSDTVGFSAYLAGHGVEYAGFSEIAANGYYWTATHTTESDETYFYRQLSSAEDRIYRGTVSVRGQGRWYSVRCLLDH